MRIEDVFKRFHFLFGYSVYYPEEERYISKVSSVSALGT